MKKTTLTVYLKGHPFADTSFLEAKELKQEIELVTSHSTIKIVSFRIAVDCDGCDLVETCTIGSKISDPSIYKMIPENVSAKNKKWLLFYDIVIKIGEQLLSTPEFIVFLK